MLNIIKNIGIFILLGLILSFMSYMFWVRHITETIPFWFYVAAGMIIYFYKLGFMYLRYFPEDKRAGTSLLKFLFEFKRTLNASKEEAIASLNSLSLFKKIKPHETFHPNDISSITYKLRNNIWYDYHRSFILLFSGDFEDEIDDLSAIYLIFGILGFFYLVYLVTENALDLLYVLYIFICSSLLYWLNIEHVGNQIVKEAKDRRALEQKIINDAINNLDSHPDDLKIL